MNDLASKSKASLLLSEKEVPKGIVLSRTAQMTSTSAESTQEVPPLIHGWVTGHCGRGNIDILCSCLFTTFLCAWTVIHLPLPQYRRDKVLPMRKRLLRSIVPALFSVLVPEFTVYNASCDFLGAREVLQTFRSFHEAELTLNVAFFVDTGGVCLEAPTGRNRQVSKNNTGDAPPEIVEEICKISEARIDSPTKSDILAKSFACLQAL